MSSLSNENVYRCEWEVTYLAPRWDACLRLRRHGEWPEWTGMWRVRGKGKPDSGLWAGRSRCHPAIMWANRLMWDRMR